MMKDGRISASVFFVWLIFTEEYDKVMAVKAEQMEKKEMNFGLYSKIHAFIKSLPAISEQLLTVGLGEDANHIDVAEKHWNAVKLRMKRELLVFFGAGGCALVMALLVKIITMIPSSIDFFVALVIFYLMIVALAIPCIVMGCSYIYATKWNIYAAWQWRKLAADKQNISAIEKDEFLAMTRSKDKVLMRVLILVGYVLAFALMKMIFGDSGHGIKVAVMVILYGLLILTGTYFAPVMAMSIFGDLTGTMCKIDTESKSK